MNKKMFVFVLAVMVVALIGGIMAYVFAKDYVQPYDFIKEYVYIGPAQPVTVELPIGLVDAENVDK